MSTSDFLISASPQEIRLRSDLLSDGRFGQLADAHKAICSACCCSPGEWIMCSTTGRRGSPRLLAPPSPSTCLPLAEFIDFFAVEGGGAGAQTERRSLTDSVPAAVLVRDGGRCRKCRSARNLEVDHIVPPSKGGAVKLARSMTQSA